MSGKGIKSDDKYIYVKWFLQKQKKCKIDDIYVDKILVSGQVN